MVFGVFMLVGTLKAFCHENPRLCSAFLVRCRAAAAACLDDNWYNHALALPTLQLAEYLVRSLIMLGIIVAMNFNIQVSVSVSVSVTPWEGMHTCVR